MHASDTVLVTRDLTVVHLAHRATPEARPDWCQTFGAALAAIRPETRLLIADAAVDAPMARLLAALFVDQRPGRLAYVVETDADPTVPAGEDRIRSIARPRLGEELAAALRAEVAATAA